MSIITLAAGSASLESARSIVTFPDGHPCHNVHGHSFQVTALTEVSREWPSFPGGEILSLRNALEETVAPLNYSYLNQVLEHPTDENLAFWIQEHSHLPQVSRISIRSTRLQGVDLDWHGGRHIWRRYRFQAAHQLPYVPPGHKCGRMHGHRFEVVVYATQSQDFHQSSITYDYIDRIWAPIQSELDYQCLNSIAGLSNPTSELISSWLWFRLKQSLPELSSVTVFETDSCGANFDGSTYRIWKDFTLDSAVQVHSAPPNHCLARLHGHTFLLRLQLLAPLDQVMGWTIDFGDVKAKFDPIFKQLDHHPLHEIAGISSSDTASLAQWIYQMAKPLLPQLVQVGLFENEECGIIVTESQEGSILSV